MATAGTPQHPAYSLVEGYATQFERLRAMVQEFRGAVRTKYYWFVGVCGYVITNASPLWETLLGHPLSRWQLFALALPWAIAALLSLLCLLKLDELEVADNIFFTVKTAAFDVLLRQMQAGKATNDDVLGVVDDRDPPIADRIKDLEKVRRTNDCLQRAAIVSLVVCFAWAVLGPMILPVIRVP